jgi:phage tail-like protein
MSYGKKSGLFFRLTVDEFPVDNYGIFPDVIGLSVRQDQNASEILSNELLKSSYIKPKYANVTLKRGVLYGLNLIEWLHPRYESLVFTSKNLNLTLVDEMDTIYASWQLVNAYPVSVELAFSETEENILIVQSLELSYNSFTRIS